VRELPRLERTAERTFDGVLSRLSTEFINIRSDHVDAKIGDGLRQLVEWIGVDRALLAQFQPNQQICVTHCYSVDGFGHLPPKIVDDELPWLATMARDGQLVRFSTPAELPPEAVNERRWCQTKRVQAHLTIPCPVGGLPVCAIAFSSRAERAWPDELVARLRLAGEIFANALGRKLADEQLQRTREELAHVVRVSTVGQLATSIAHEINQPLCAVMTNAHAAMELLAKERPDLAEARAALNDIIQDAKRAGEVVARSHTMLKRHSVEHTPQDLRRLAEGVRSVAGNYAMIRRVQFDMSVETVPPVLGHGVQIQQVMTNLLTNALDAIGPDQSPPGRVQLSLRFDEKAARVVVRVQDNGMGVAPEVSRAIIKAHGGTLWMEPNAQRGATFCFSLPIQKENHNDQRRADRAGGR
jgi:nitrogen-specific signal transduction histidine kinase